MTTQPNPLQSNIVLRRVMRLLESLKNNSSGEKIYQHIEQSLTELESKMIEAETGYTELVETLLDSIRLQLESNSPLHASIEIIKASLTPSAQHSDFLLLKAEVRHLIEELAENPPQKEAKPTVTPFGATPSNVSPLRREFTPPPHQEVKPSPPPVDNKALEEVKAQKEEMQSAARELQQTHNQVIGLKRGITDQIEGALKSNNNLAHLLKDSMEAIRYIEPNKSLEVVRLTYLRRAVDLLKKHQDLTTELEGLCHRMSSVEITNKYIDTLPAVLASVESASANIDELTQLPNQTKLLEELESEISRTHRYGAPLTLAVIEPSDLSAITDRYGNDAKASVLKHFAEVTPNIFRQHDVLARYSEEGFAVLMPNTGIDGAVSALKKVQTQLNDFYCRLQDGSVINSLIISAGIALYSAGETAEDLTKHADMAIYRAKRSGVNRIEIHTSEAATNTPSGSL